MGKTYRNEKSFKPKKKGLRPLNNSRDLPDYSGFYDNPATEEEQYDAERISLEELDDKPPKD